MAKMGISMGRGKVPRLSSTKETKYLLRIPEDLRREIRIEAMTRNMDMSTYICALLKRRPR